jgi:hypothetical protein
MLTTTEAFTKYTEVFAIPNKEAETMADIVFTKWICQYRCPSIIHSDGGKRIPEQNCCKTLSKIGNRGLDESTLNGECYLAPLMFCYNISYNRLFQNFTISVNLPHKTKTTFSSHSKINKSQGLVAERLQILKKASQIALDNSMEASESYSRKHDAKAEFHDFKERDISAICEGVRMFARLCDSKVLHY